MTLTSNEEEKLQFLKSHGANSVDHSSADLLSHLQGVKTLLTTWQARLAVCDAGLFHSVYGTEVFTAVLIPHDLRPKVKALIGEEAEELAYLFGVMDRLSFYDNLFEPGKWLIECRLSGMLVAITEGQFRDLCDLVVANWLEQRSRFTAEDQFSKKREFQLMRGYLLPASRAALDAAYGFREAQVRS